MSFRSQQDEVSGGPFHQDRTDCSFLFPRLLTLIFTTVETSLNKLEEMMLCCIIMHHGPGKRVGDVRNSAEVFNLLVKGDADASPPLFFFKLSCRN